MKQEGRHTIPMAGAKGSCWFSCFIVLGRKLLLLSRFQGASLLSSLLFVVARATCSATPPSFTFPASIDFSLLSPVDIS